jgi:hypothetical protein
MEDEAMGKLYQGRNLKVYKKPQGYVVKTPVMQSWLAGPFATKAEAYAERDRLGE